MYKGVGKYEEGGLGGGGGGQLEAGYTPVPSIETLAVVLCLQ